MLEQRIQNLFSASIEAKRQAQTQCAAPIAAAGQRMVTVEGPLLAEESAVVHEGFWTGDA